jgi:hypothetical protein
MNSEDERNAMLFLEYADFDQEKADELSKAYWAQCHKDLWEYYSLSEFKLCIWICVVLMVANMIVGLINLIRGDSVISSFCFVCGMTSYFRGCYLFRREVLRPKYERMGVKHWLDEFADLGIRLDNE